MRVWKCLIGVPFAAALTGAAPGGPQQETQPPGFTMTRTGAQTDFDYFEGAWVTTQRQLKLSGEKRGQWETFPGTLCKTRYLGGLASVDELYFPETRHAGLTLRLFEPTRKQWSIYWVNGRTGKLDPIPVVGGFEGNRGEFYADDKLDGRPIKVRYLWILKDRDHARWEQAFSFDNRTWETNWIADFTRADAAEHCDQGRPKR